MNSPSSKAGKAKELIRFITLSAVLGVLLNAVKFVLSPLANIELVSVFLIIYGRQLRFKALGPLYVFVAIEILIYGINDWTAMYLYVWLIPVILGMLFKNNTSPFFWAFLNGIFGLIFGTLCSLVYLPFGFSLMIGKIVSGLLFDAIHCVGNYFTALLLFRPLSKAFASAIKKTARN